MALENSFYYDLGGKTLSGSACPPIPPCAYHDNEVVTVQELSYFGVQSGGDETPVSV